MKSPSKIKEHFFNSCVITVVLYKVTPLDSDTLKSLRKVLTELNIRPHVLVYINSTPKDRLHFPHMENWKYITNYKNDYITPNYNRSLEFAINNKINWLITFDQDSHITEDYLIEASNISVLTQVAVPIVCSGHRIASPYVMKKWRTKLLYKIPNFKGNLGFINSFTIYSVRFLIESGGFPVDFPLDYSDHEMSLKLRATAHDVCILDVEVEHDLSIFSDKKLDRLESVSKAELLFVKKNYGFFSLMALTIKYASKGIVSAIQGKIQMSTIYFRRCAEAVK